MGQTKELGGKPIKGQTKRLPHLRDSRIIGILWSQFNIWFINKISSKGEIGEWFENLEWYPN